MRLRAAYKRAAHMQCGRLYGDRALLDAGLSEDIRPPKAFIAGYVLFMPAPLETRAGQGRGVLQGHVWTSTEGKPVSIRDS